MLDFSLPISLLFASINGLIFLVLSALVVRGRFSEQVSIGSGGKERLEVAIRVHGNFAEYVPFALLLLALLEASGTSDTVLYSLGAILTAARLCHAYGLSHTLAPNAFRAGGTMATWVVIGASCLIGLYQVAS